MLEVAFTIGNKMDKLAVEATDLKHWSDPYRKFGLLEKSFIGLAIVLLLGVGTLLHALIISFERFAGDPQKRGLSNQVE